MTTDQEILSQTQTALRTDARISSQGVEVSVNHGVTTLRGVVPSWRRKLAAHEIAASIKGCKEVLNEIEVHCPGEVPDDEVADQVRGVLEQHIEIPLPSVAVSVVDGQVRLDGTVASEADRTLAEDIALSAPGTRCVRNHLIVDSNGVAVDETLGREIESELAGSSQLLGSSIKVAIVGNAAVLSGHVTEPWQRDFAGAAAMKFPVCSVRNQITVHARVSQEGSRDQHPGSDTVSV